MAQTTEEAYLEGLWMDEDEDEQEAPVLQQSLTQQDPLPSYQELMGQGAGAISLRRPATNGHSGPAANGNGSSSARGPSGDRPNGPLAPFGHRATGAGAGTRLGSPGAAGSRGGGGGAGAGDLAQLKRRLHFVVRSVDMGQSRYEEALLEANKATDLVRSMEAEVSSLQQEAEELSRRLPPAPERQRQVLTWLEQRAASLESQRGVQSAKQLELISAEAALRAAERELEFLAETREGVQAAQAAETAAATYTVAALRAREEKAVAGYQRRQAAEAARLAEAQALAEEAAKKRVQAAEEGREKVLARLKSETERFREGLAAQNAALAAEQARRRDAVLDLKNSLAGVEADVAKQAELAAVVARQRRELQEKEFGALVEAGMNPYEVFRRRDQQEESQRVHSQIQSNIASRQLQLAAQLAREQEAYQRTMAARQRDKADRQEFDREMGVAARQARVEEFMRAHTAAGVDMLDPTGRLPFHPSEVTLVKDARFGSGGARPELLAKQVARLGPQAPNPLLLPAKYRGGSAEAEAVAGLGYSRGLGGSDEEGEGMGSPPRSPRPQLPGDQLHSQQSSRQPPSSTPGSAPDRYKLLAPRPPTKLEADLMEAAKARHKTNIGSAQTQMGRTFAGDAFLASPLVIDFKDYDMGRTSTFAVQIINRSYKKNTFRVLGIPVEYCDVLDFSYKLPGYLAPGVSGEVVVSFTPKAPLDIDTELQLLADTGPFTVPIRCRTKRATLSVAPAAVDFGAGVTLGDTATRTFVIANDGALEVEYRLDSPQLTDDERALIKSTANLNNLLTSATVAAAAAAAAAAAPAPSGSLSRARSFASLAVGGEPGTTGDGAPVVAPRDERRLTHGGFTVFPCVGVLKGYSKVTFTVTFAPILAAPARLVLQASYKAPSVKRLALPHHEVVVTGVGRDVPVYLERPIIDFQCCLTGHVYRDILQVRNGGKTAMKVTVVPRPELEGFFEFSPDFGFVQAGDSFPITILFKPTSSLMAACRRHVVDPEKDQVIEVPMRLSVPDQTLPVHFTLRAQITNTDLLFDPPSLDFGDCVIAERTAVRLHIRNPGRLPQTFGFVGLPGGLRISPNDGFGYVLPGESLERLMSYQPPIAGPQSFSVTAKTLAGRSFTLPCRANGVIPRLSLSTNRIRMPATAVGDTRTVSVVLINKTDAPQAYEFAVPPLSDLTFSPHVGQVPPLTRLRVQIDYSPRPPEEGEPSGIAPPPPAQEYDNDADGDGRHSPDWPGLDSPEGSGRRRGGGGSGNGTDGEGEGDDEFNEVPAAARSASPQLGKGGAKRSPSPLGAAASKGKSGGGDDEGDEDGDGDGEEDEEGGDGEEDGEEGDASAVRSQWRRLHGATSSNWYRYREHTITCYIRPQQQPSQPPHNRQKQPTGAAAAAASSDGVQEVHLQLSTCAVLPDLVLNTSLPYVAVHQCHCLDFGPVPVGQRVVRTLQVANEGSESMSLKAEPLDTREVFSCVNALRPVRPGATFRMLVSFTPQARTEYLEMLSVSSARTRLKLVLKGAGIAPELQLGPEGVAATGLELGDVLVGETSSRPLTLTNVCPFPLSFSLVLKGLPSAADPNPAMRPPFAAQPAEGTLAQGESCEVTVSFSPSAQRPYFEDVLQVIVPNQQDQLLVPLRGRGWQEGVFVAGPTYPDPDPDPFLLHELAAATSTLLPPAIAASAGTAGGASHVPVQSAHAAAPAGGKPNTPGGGGKPVTPGAARKAAAAAAAAAAATAAAGPSEPRVLTLTFPDSVYGGEIAKASFDVGVLRSTANGTAPGELFVHELPAEARQAGWSVAEPAAAASAGQAGSGGAKVPLAAGEVKPVVLSYAPPKEPPIGTVAAYGHAEFRTLKLQCTLRGGLPALSGGPDGRQVVVLARCKLLPGTRPEGEPLPPSVTDAAAAAAAAHGSHAAAKKVPAAAAPAPSSPPPGTPPGGK